MKTVIKISVRILVEFVLRSGDLVSSFSGSARAAEGTKAHKLVQKLQPPQYRPEVTLNHTVEAADFILQICGRADGIIDLDEVVIDEIKSTEDPLDSISEMDNPLFWAQAKCYAYMYSQQQNLEKIQVQLTYYQLNEKTIKRYCRSFSRPELSLFFSDLVSRYLTWAQTVRTAQNERNRSIQQTNFPFAVFRPGQRELAVAIYRSIAAKNNLFAQAPTGIGKTLATLFPAIKAIGAGKSEKLFYLTAKTSTREIAEQTLSLLHQGGLLFKSLTLTAKDKICLSPDTDCDPNNCSYACGYYDRIHSALAEIYVQPVFTRTVIENCAKKHHVCPFEFSLELALWADGVICDYNYVFDPRVSLKRFFGEDQGQYILLIDEAHNLIDRAREMFSATIEKKPLTELKKAIKSSEPKLAKMLTAVVTCLNRWGKVCDQNEEKQHVQQLLPEEVLSPMYRFLQCMDQWLAKKQAPPFREQLLQVFFAIHAFIRTAEEFDEKYVFYAEKSASNITGKLFCIDPSRILQRILTSDRPAVFFSATLSPIEYFRESLGGKEADACLTVDSPFPRENLCIMAADNISTTYKRRNSSCELVCDAIQAVTETRPGNYLVFFPSYRYLEEVKARLTQRNSNVERLYQSSTMTDAERSAFLDRFSNQPEGTLIGFAVLGGAFGEGIDLVGERLCGVVVVSIGLPQLGLERNLIRQFHNAENGMGFEYAYLYPGINKVLQAAGRVIRTDSDKGVVLLIDERFTQPRCQRILPSWWQPIKVVRGAAAIQATSREFWSG